MCILFVFAMDSFGFGCTRAVCDGRVNSLGLVTKVCLCIPACAFAKMPSSKGESLLVLSKIHIDILLNNQFMLLVIGSLLSHENAFAPTSRPKISAPPSLAEYLRCVVPPS